MILITVPSATFVSAQVDCSTSFVDNPGACCCGKARVRAETHGRRRRQFCLLGMAFRPDDGDIARRPTQACGVISTAALNWG